MGWGTLGTLSAESLRWNMFFPVDMKLLDGGAHSPTVPTLERSMKGKKLRLMDFCIPVNPYFPTEKMFRTFRGD